MTNQNKSYAHFTNIVNLLRNAYIPNQLFTKFRGGPLRGPVVWGPLVSCLKVHTVRYASAYLLVTTTEITNAKNYRPITCLLTTYKILTSILTDRMYAFMEANKLFPLEQTGCKKGSYGCKDQLLINLMLMENYQRSDRNLSMTWIDY